ncbi:reprolysin-like metallopeptidase [Lacinutrix sp.]|uniref:zinc-dependent metalloprotease n=3 Tax=Lacinutrix sp. TaxID=1937692 RepID=UPI00263114DF|nr:zinc-dependent metalloprotease family protein [Lacinutrix sp.]MDG1714266.1 M12 family metallo-peptidase [Lacinutrix sp.]
MKTKLINVLTFTMLLFVSNVIAQNNAWSKTTVKEEISGISLKNLDPDNSEILQLDIQNFKQQLIGAPLRGASNGKSNVIVNFPSVDGKIQQYRIVETQIFSSNDNQAQHPGIKTYLGSRTDGSGTRVRFSVTPLGLKAMISEPDKETVYIQPVTKVSNGQYIVYNRTAQINSSDTFECLTEDVDISKRIISSEVSRDANDKLLRTFRMAMSVTSEYTNFQDDGNAGNGNAQQDALAAMVSTLNRTNEVFEVDMAITFVLVDTADDPALDLIYSGTDPYGGNLNGDLQTNLTATVGEADYDIGHLLHFAGNNGNAGCIGCVCENGKGSGFSAHSFVDNDGGPYMADFFDIDYVPHEIGHQMGANHTFSNNTEGTGVNSEPGSGTTIMGYAGITGPNDVQDHSDPYFHYQSINQILNNVTSGANQCAVTTSITNNPPVAAAGADFAIPNGTAFILKATATDPDSGDILTYTWEQIDSGQTTNAQFGPTHGGPLWRSRPPSTSGDRYMPIYSRVLAGELTETNPTETVNNSSWETVSTIARTLSFGLTVRDRSEAGGVGQIPQSDFDTMVVTVEGGAPFTVVSPPAWGSGSSQTLVWNVGATNTAPINCQTVNIKFSTDGGLTFPTTLASGVANDGSETITVPSVADTNNARVMVEAADNIFYALSDNFPISSAPSFALNSAISNQSACNIDAVSYEVDFFTVNGFNESTTFTASGNPPGSSYDFMPSTLSSDGIVMLNITGLTGATPGDYTITVTGTSNSQTKTIDLMLTVVDGLCASVANTDYQTSTTLVQFGTINNASGKPSGYSDYTNADPTTDPDLTTEVTVGSSYDLFVNQNTDGNYTCITTVWIDWNQNCILEASEAYDLGTAFGTPDGPASNSGLSVLVPTNAVVGNTIMRVTTKYNSGATSCENGHDAEVEDYTITVVPLLSVDEFGSLGGFSVYPNPNNGSFNVELNSVSSNDINISVFDIRGREVFNNIYKASTVFNETIRLDKVQSGIYMLQVSDGLNKHTKKVIIN